MKLFLVIVYCIEKPRLKIQLLFPWKSLTCSVCMFKKLSLEQNLKRIVCGFVSNVIPLGLLHRDMNKTRYICLPYYLVNLSSGLNSLFKSCLSFSSPCKLQSSNEAFQSNYNPYKLLLFFLTCICILHSNVLNKRRDVCLAHMFSQGLG